MKTDDQSEREVMNAAERWERYEERAQTHDEGEASLSTFALRADGVLVFFDEDGWFTMEWRDSVGGSFIYACDPDGTAHSVYCEPVWLAGYYETLRDEAVAT